MIGGIYTCKPSDADYDGLGWSGFILAFMEQNDVYDQFDFSVRSFVWPPNFRATAARIDAFICPSDPQNGEMIYFTTVTPKNGPNPWDDCRQTNMAGVSDSHDWTCDAVYPENYSKIDGIMGNLQGCRIRDISDGTSHTLTIAEITGAGEGTHHAHIWASHNLIDTYDPINGPNTVPGGFDVEMISSLLQYGSYNWSFRRAGPSSYHPGGCHFALADGSSQFINEDIASEVLWSLTTKAGTRSDGSSDMPIPVDSF